jgi:hypothetical protein
MTYHKLLGYIQSLPPNVRSVERFLRLYFTEEFIGDPSFDHVCRDLAIYGNLTYMDTYWNDVQGVLAGVNPVGPAAPPQGDTAGEGWLYDGNSTELAVITVQTPHDMLPGSDIYPHVHWRKTTDAAGDVLWHCDARAATPGGDFGAYAEVGESSTPVAGTVDNDTAARHLVTSFGVLSMTGASVSTIVHFKLSRLGGTDSYGADALALSFDCHYQIAAPGTANQF